MVIFVATHSTFEKDPMVKTTAGSESSRCHAINEEAKV